MNIRAWWSRLRGTLRRDEGLERDMEQEMAFHLEMATRRNIARGMPHDVASREARMTFGGVDAVKEDARDAHRARTTENVVSDVRFAIRALRRAPSFALATMLTMALGIGASTAIFTVVNAAILRPLPIPDPKDFAYIGWAWEKGGDIPALSAFQYRFLREHPGTFSAITTYNTQEAALGNAESAAPVSGLSVNGDFFRAVGFEPRLGRAFDASELETGSSAVVILGDAVWRARFGADTSLPGHTVLFNGESRTVVGVMPPDFRFPPAPNSIGFIVPMAVRANPADEGHNSSVMARLRHGTSNAARDAELAGLSDRFRAAYPALAGPHDSFKRYTHNDVYVGNSARRTLWTLFGAVSLVLLIACANTATLLLVRASGRQREIAVRVSIGAGPARILQQLLVEGLVLAALSASLGVLVGIVSLRSFIAVAPSALPTGLMLGLDGRVLAFAIAITVATGLVFGLAAAVPSFRMRRQSGVLSAARGATGGGTRMRESLVFLETASAVVLLAGATMLTASFARLTHVDPGFDTDHVVAVRLGRLPASYNAERRAQLVTRLVERVRNIPGVQSVAAAPNLPLERGMNFPVDTRENPELAVGAVELRPVSPDYFTTLGVRLTGRDFDNGDVAGSEPVAIVNRAFAKHFWGDESPIGRTIRIGHMNGRWLNPRLERATRVIGVADDIREIGLDRAPRPTVLTPRTQGFDDRVPVLLMRGTVSATVLNRDVLAEDPQLTPRIEALDAVVSRSVAGPRFRTLLLGTFAGSALLLAAIGIYGVIAAMVEQRRREIGIRLSLGASRMGVALRVVHRCLVSVSAGAVVGLVAFWVLRRNLTSMLYNTSTGDPRILATAVVMLAFVAAFAAWIPARRASNVDPAITLRLD